MPGATINRFCSSGLQTIALAAQRIMVGEADAIVAGGVESISCVQNELNQHMHRDAWLTAHKPEIYWSMLETAETVARRYGIFASARTNTVSKASAAPRPQRQPAGSWPRSC